MFRCGAVLFVSILPSLLALAQPSSNSRPEPKTLLHEIEQQYRAARYYQIEAVEEEVRESELSRFWYKSIQTAALGSQHQYRFAARNQVANWLQISDGTTEWTYSKTSDEYIEQSTPEAGPFRFKAPWDPAESQLIDAQDLLKRVPDLLARVRNPVFLSDEKVMIAGKPVLCYVLHGEAKRAMGWNPGVRSELTLWIDHQTRLLRKSRSVMSGPVILSLPDVNYTLTTVVTFPLVELAEPPADLFSLTLPKSAKKVTQFEDPFQPHGRNMAGQAAPAVNFKPANAKPFTLQSMVGKPVLLEFWATWCGPCREAMPSLEKLYPKLATEGVAVLTVDEDNEAGTAERFLSEHHANWTNIHDEDGDIGSAFPGNGIPEFVVINRDGTIVGSKSGFDKRWLDITVAQALR